MSIPTKVTKSKGPLRMDGKKVIYYKDELNDEFSSFKTTPKVIDGTYVYEDNSFKKKFSRFFLYRIITYPIAVLYAKLAFNQKIVGKEKLRPYIKKGFFLYGNHTQPTGDALMQARLVFPNSSFVLVHPNNLSVPFIGRFTPSLGALPIPDSVSAYRNFKKAIEHKIKQGHPVVIYPEAHIWPYYTKIRPFADTSFAYPVNLQVPAFCFVNTYQKRLIGKKPRIVTYLDGPFYPEAGNDPKTQRKQLRDIIYKHMSILSEKSNTEYIRYIKGEADNG